MTTNPAAPAQDAEHWAGVAADWITWARTPGHDAFWAYRDAFAAFVGPGSGPAADIGCGEGRQSRLLSELGYEVTACDPVAAMLDAARASDSATTYHQAPATALPLADGACGLTLLYNCLMDIEAAEAALVEAARVTAPDGRLILSIVHPVVDLRAACQDRGLDGIDYFANRAFSAIAEDNGLQMHFSGWARPLGFYIAALNAAGLQITGFCEPPASRDPAYDRHARWRRLPLFLWIEAKHPRAELADRHKTDTTS